MSTLFPFPDRRRLIAFFLVLLVLDFYLYFRHIGHFFQADAIFLLYHRPDSLPDFLRRFIRLDPGGWYRPLANNVVEAILSPIFGMKPRAYRIPVYAVFFADTVAVYALVFTITHRELTSMIATFFFNIHTTNAYVTYDIGFLPELLVTLFYICSVVAYLRYVEAGARFNLFVSLSCFVAGLLSKEMAITLPGVILALHVVLFEHGAWRDRIVNPLIGIRWHTAILACYLFFAIGHLHVMNLSFETLAVPQSNPYGGFNPTFGTGMLQNLDLASTWAFNIPRTWNTDHRNLSPNIIFVLKAFRAFVVGILVILLFTAERKKVMAGLAWFVVALIPALPMIGHLLPYYIFLPLVGFSLLIGVAFSFVHDKLKRPLYLGSAVAFACLVGMFYICSVSIPADASNHILLGGSSEAAVTTLNDIQKMYPVLRGDETIYIIDDEEPLWWHHASGDLVRLAYNQKDLTIYYSSLLERISPRILGSQAIVLRYEGNHLVDYSDAFRSDPLRFAPYKDPGEQRLRLSATNITAGDSYFMEISGLHDMPVQVAYSLNDGRTETFSVTLDAEGRANFTASAGTRKGIYRFVGYSLDGKTDWFRSGATIAVH